MNATVFGCSDDDDGGGQGDSTAGAGGQGGVGGQGGGGDRYVGLETDRYLGQLETLATVEDSKVFLEGPAVAADGKVYFNNIPVSKTLVYDPATRQVSTLRENTHAANGMLFDRQGALLICEGGALTGDGTGVGRVVRLDVPTLAETVLVDAYQGRELQPPNDLTFDDQGRIYFSSRPNATDATDEAAGTVNAVYRLDPGGALTRLLAWPDVDKPNGIATSPDYRTLYLIDAHGGAGMARELLAFDLAPDGSLSNRRTLYTFYPGRSGDGMAVDALGNLYVAAGLHNTRNTSETLDTRPGIHVISPAGKLLAFRETPVDVVTNCRFGGADLKALYITCNNLLLRLPTVNPGKADYLPPAAPPAARRPGR
ncbi:MAG TPA: SMP-30/gluconolactonase/LRE family protein [Polyangiaceae bacterium]|nr:SMP-30/gluconolactonase/LRE family protein [Polyangiaceae bacterium]